jgi:thiamine-monophosphate kinase
MPTLRELGEVEAVRRLTATRAETPGVVIGAGDDAAVVRPSPRNDLVATTDAFVEGRHYRPEWIDPEALGARLALANLSDLAAMAAVPRWALIARGVRADHDIDELLAFERGVSRVLSSHDATVVGGNLAAVEGPEWSALTLIGEVESGGAWTRAAARPGDLVAVTGAPGRAGAAVRLLGEIDRAELMREWPGLWEAWSVPPDRIAAASALAATGGVTAAIDLSDGLALDLARVCEASGVGAELESGAVPSDPELTRAAERWGEALKSVASGASDDYELLMAVDPNAREACARAAAERGVPLTFVGRFTDAPGILAWRSERGSREPLLARGYDHFAG